MDTDHEARNLLGPLRDTSAPPSTLDIGGAVVRGQRRLRKRRLTAAGAIFISLVPVSLALMDRQPAAQVAFEAAPSATPTLDQIPPPATFPTSCTARVLPAPPGATFTFVDHGDSSGRYLVGGYADGNGNRRPLLWDNGTLVRLDSTPGQENTSIVVNEHGVVAGTNTTVIEGKIDFYNWTYRDGAVTLITEVGHGPIEYRGVIDINARGDILLDARMRNVGVPAQHQGPAIWSGGQLRELTAPANLKDVVAMSLDDDGTVVGRHLVSEGFAGERALLWAPDGKASEFNAPNGFGPAGTLRHVRNGWVVGGFKVPGNSEHQADVLANLKTQRFTRVELTMAWAVNRHGWVAGFETGPQRTQIPTIAGDGKKLTLPIPEGAKPADEISAASISDDGRTVGGTVMVTGTERHLPVVWNCS